MITLVVVLASILCTLSMFMDFFHSIIADEENLSALPLIFLIQDTDTFDIVLR